MWLAIVAFWSLAALPGALRVLLARLGGMALHEVSLGVGPALWRRGALRLRAIPVGVFVRIGGLVPGERPFSPEDPRAFAQRPWPFQLLVHISGIISYYIFAAALMVVFTAVWGRTVAGKQPLVGVVKAGLPAEVAGLQPGDEIVSIDGHAMRDSTEVAPVINASGGRQIEITVMREGERRSFFVTPACGESCRIGIEIWAKEEQVPAGAGEALLEGARFPLRYAQFILHGFGEIFVGRQKAEFAGPVGIVKVTERQAARGAQHAVSIVAVLTVYWMLFFALPIPGLDGGRLIAWIFRRRRRATGEARDLGTVEKTRMRIPIAVAGTLSLWSLAAAAGIFAALQNPVLLGEVLLALGIAYGIVRRHPAAFRIGRTLPFMMLPGALGEGAILAAVLFGIGVFGWLPSTARWFGMVCPACGSRDCGASPGGGYGCLACGSVWRI